MKYFLTLTSFVIVFICKSQNISYGLASPIQIKEGKTIIYKNDYLPFGHENMRVKLPEGLSIIDETDETYTLVGKLSRPLDNIRFILNDEFVDVPCRNSKAVSLNTTFTLPNAVYSVGIKGSFNNWVIDTTLLKPLGKLPTDSWKIENLVRNEGYEQFKLVANGQEFNPLHLAVVSNGMGGANSLLQFGEPEIATPFACVEAIDSQGVNLRTYNASYYFAYWNNTCVAKGTISITGLVRINYTEDMQSLQGRSHLRILTCNRNKMGNDVLIPLENGRAITETKQLNRKDLHTQIMYFMMVDRFANGDIKNDAKPASGVLPKAQYMGGDLKGIQQKISTQYFNQLGCNTLWLSPVSQNTKGTWGLWNKGVTTQFTAYHGYWPTSYSKVDERFGTNKQFKELIDEAHRNNTNIILDFVAHHIHTDHPLYKKHPDWATPLTLPDGTLNTERWDDHRLTTWFDTFLPTLNFDNKIVRETVADSVLFWVRNFDLDGFRHDASKHVPEDFWRLLTYKIKTEKRDKPYGSFYQIGETYGSSELIGSYVNSGQMDAQFDFNVYDASVAAFISNAYDTTQRVLWKNLERTLKESYNQYGYHHLMGNISGNQDKPRFTSLADGSIKPNEDTKLAGWTRTIQNQGEIGYKRMTQLMAFNLTQPGVPVIYYGDEIAMPGANDPDNRRMMQFDGWNESQQTLVNSIKQLTHLRKTNMALLYGDIQFIKNNPDFFAYERVYCGKKVVVIFSKKAGSITLPILATENARVSELFKHSFQYQNNRLILNLQADDVAIFTID
jgi:cyclomaltodextrinase / maltogenic alpha-amylase / neopullulanase